MHHDPDHLLVLARRVAGRIIRNPMLADEAGERAMHRYQLAVLAGEGPDKPEAWIRTVARRSACALLRNSWARMQPLADESTLACRELAESHLPSPDALRELLAGALTARQREALEAALTSRTVRDAARICHMEPRDFRRYLAAISRRARKRLDGNGAGIRATWSPSCQYAG